ncbi:NPP1 family protein [Spongiactinospora sp. TRM90649]|uniref:NPP1 family protein n=1 Tax=Spongiactinospora sp. TRM90649 TaxID=3031114 RepID=UPI0023F8C7D1|nr:NPP1 family protein [Spongiactinospora sp. TRM90649]MDF5751901.1 NPP1 family protein [Spongiactinospora sp. TRM90649]
MRFPSSSAWRHATGVSRRGTRPRLAVPALVMSLIAGTAITFAAPPAWAEPPPKEIPQEGHVSDAHLKFQPFMDYDNDGCYPSVAIGRDGAMNPGLELGGARNGACHDESDLDNSNMYARTRCNSNGWCVHKYALYFQKDQKLDGDLVGNGHVNDWEHVVVWTKDDKVRYVAASQHGSYVVREPSEIEMGCDREGETNCNHPKIVYHLQGGDTHSFRFADKGEQPENHYKRWHLPDLISWSGFPTSALRDKLAAHNWGSATLALKDQNNEFARDLAKAHRRLIAVDDGYDEVELPFDFDIYTNEVPAGMADPNSPPDDDPEDGGSGDNTADSLRVMGLGSSSVYGQGSSHGNGYRDVADHGFSDLYENRSPLTALAAEDTTPKVDWVGSVRVGTMPDRDIEGWKGYRIDQIAGKAQCAVKTYQPNLITLIAGGNDVIYDDRMDTAIDRLESLIKQVIRDSRGVTVLVAGMQPFRDAGTDQRGRAFTAQIDGLVERLAREGEHVVYADTTGLTHSDIGSDGIHATDEGYRKIGEAFVKAARYAKDKGWIYKPNPFAPNVHSNPCGLKDDGTGAEGAQDSDPSKLGPYWDDRGVIQDKQYDSSNRYLLVDINKDGKAEFVFVDKYQNFRFWWNSGPSGKNWVPFVEGQNSYRPAAGAVGNQLRFGDIDGDGFPDCMIVDLTGRVTAFTWKGENPSGSRMCMRKYDGVASVFSNGSEGDRLNTDPATKIRFADVTGGGRDDYLLIKPDGTTTAWYNRDFQTKDDRKWLDWTPPKKIGGALVNPRQIRYADINGDKRADRILITARGGARAWLNEGARGAGGKYRDIGRIAGDAEVPPKDVQFADMDGDGKADFVRIGWTGVAHAWLNKLPPDYFNSFHP